MAQQGPAKSRQKPAQQFWRHQTPKDIVLFQRHPSIKAHPRGAVCILTAKRIKSSSPQSMNSGSCTSGSAWETTSTCRGLLQTASTSSVSEKNLSPSSLSSDKSYRRTISTDQPDLILCNSSPALPSSFLTTLSQNESDTPTGIVFWAQLSGPVWWLLLKV